MARRYFQLKIFPRGVVSTTGAASYTLGSSYFRDAPLVGGQIVRAAECQVESNPWRVTLVDIGSTFTAKIANSSGRLHLLGRLCQLRSALDSTASFAPIGTGRLTDLALNEDVASWDLDISDERWIERQTDIFAKSNTMAIVPHGPISQFQEAPPIPVTQTKWVCKQKTSNVVCLRYDGGPRLPIDQATADIIVNDAKVGVIPGNSGITAGNFQTLRFRNFNNSTDYEIAAFGFTIITPGGRPTYPTHSIYGFWNDPVLLNGSETNHTDAWSKLYVWLVWSASQPALDSAINGYLYAPSHEPTDTLPQLIGGAGGLHPGRLVRNAYAGTYSATTSITVRASTAALDRWENEAAYGKVWFQITSPQNMADFLDERIYGPYNVAPVVDSSGKIAPTRMWLPTSTQLNVAGLAQITSTNALSAPTWSNPSREAVTAVRYTQEHYGSFESVFAGLPANLRKASTQGSTYIHDTVTLLGRRQLTFRMGSVLIPGITVPPTTIPGGVVPRFAVPLQQKLAGSIFTRFGDGPIYTEVQVSSSIDATTNGAILPGAFVKMNVQGIYPNPVVPGRSGTRIMQVLKRDITPYGRAFSLLDAASTLASLSAPTLTMALSSQSSRHAIKITVASVSSGARFEVHLGASSSTSSTSRPAANSSRWFPAVYNSTGALVNVVGQLPSKTKIWGRVRQARPMRISSPWSTANISVVMASITAPSGFSVTGLTAASGTAKWTNGSSVYGTEVMVDASSVATLTSTNVVGIVPPQTTRFTYFGLNANDTHKGGVRHFDPYGGKSAQATGTFTTTTGSAPAAPAMRGLVFVTANP